MGTLWRVQSNSWTSKEFVSLEVATLEFERTKDYEMDEGVAENSYVEIVVSHDNFENQKTVRLAKTVIDEEKMEKEGSPDKRGHDFLWWAKWQDVSIHASLECVSCGCDFLAVSNTKEYDLEICYRCFLSGLADSYLEDQQSN